MSRRIIRGEFAWKNEKWFPLVEKQYYFYIEFLWLPSIIEFEDLHEEEKIEILFEKRYFNYVFEKLRNSQNDLIADGTTDSEVDSILHSISHVLNFQQFYEDKVKRKKIITKTIKNKNNFFWYIDDYAGILK